MKRINKEVEIEQKRRVANSDRLIMEEDRKIENARKGRLSTIVMIIFVLAIIIHLWIIIPDLLSK